MEVRFCHMCGSKLQGSAKFCGTCGTPVLQLTPSEPQPVQPEPVAVIPEPEPVQPEPVVVLPEPEPVQPEPVVVLPEPEPVQPEPVVVIPEPEPVQPEPVAVIPEPVPVQPEPVAVIPEPEPVQPEPVVAIPEPVPVQPEPVVVIPDPEPVQPEPVAVIPEPVPVQPEPVVVIPEPQPVQPEPVAVHTAPAPAAPAPAAAPASAAPVKVKKDPYPKRGVGRTILATLLCIFIFLWSFAALIIHDIRQATTGDQLTENLQTAVEDMNLAEMSAADVMNGVEDPELSLVEWSLQQITDNYDGTVVASEKDIEDFLERATFSTFLTEKASAYMNDVYTGSETSGVTSEELQQLLKENAPLVEEVFGHPLYEQDIENFVQQVEDMGILENLNAKTLEKEYAPVYYGVQIGISYWVVGFFCALAILFMLLLAKTNQWNLLRTSGDIGITLTVLGCVMVLAALFSRILPDIWNSMFGGIAFIGSLSGAALFGGILPAVILVGVGVLLILIQSIGKMIVRKSAKKQVQ